MEHPIKIGALAIVQAVPLIFLPDISPAGGQ